MSENAGLFNNKNLKKLVKEAPKKSQVIGSIKIKERDGVLMPTSLVSEQKGIEDLRYSPFQRGSMSRSEYKVQGHDMNEKCVKKDPFRPAVSFIPRTRKLLSQPAVNIAQPVYDALDYNPVKEIPDQTVCNNLSEIRNYRQTNKKLMDLLDTRARAREQVRRTMRKVNPLAPHIVDVKRHRKMQAEDNILNQVLKQRGIEKLFSDK